MRKFILFFVVLSLISISVNAQKKSIMDDVTVSGLLQTGSSYLGLVGIHPTENMTFYTEFYAFHKTGVGLCYFSLDDFSSEKTGRIRFFDLAYAKKWDNNLSIFTAVEYYFYDNWKDGKAFKQYTKLAYTKNGWMYEVAPVFRFFPEFNEDKFELTAYLKVKKNLFKDFSILGQIWYDNVYKDLFYGTVSAQVDLPKNFYLMGNLLYRDRKVTSLLNLGWRFSTKK